MMRRLAEGTDRRSKATWLVAVAVLVATFQGNDALEADQRRLTLRLALVDAAALHEGVRRAIDDELERIFGRIDLGIEMVDAGTLDAEPALDGVFKVLLLSRDGRAWGVPADAMGATPPVPGPTVCNTVYVFQPVILETLTNREGRHRSLSRLQVGRAIARVIVHELVHALAPERPHAEQGIMAPDMGPSQLLGPGRGLDADSARAVEASLLRRRAGSPASGS